MNDGDLGVDILFCGSDSDLEDIAQNPNKLAYIAMKEPFRAVDVSLRPEDLIYEALSPNFKTGLRNLVCYIQRRSDKMRIFSDVLATLNSAHNRVSGDNSDIKAEEGQNSQSDALLMSVFNVDQKLINEAALICARNYILSRILAENPSLLAGLSKDMWRELADDLEVELRDAGIDPEVAFSKAWEHAPANSDFVFDHIINLGKATGPSASPGPADPSAG
jgi:hypothetical protein